MKKYSLIKSNRVIDGNTKYLNLKPIAGQAKLLAIDVFGNLGTTEGGASAVSWTDITNKPTTFAPTIGSTATTALAGNTVIPVPATVAPLAPGTATIGTSLLYARQDHVHPTPASVAALTTGRTFSLTGGATGTSAAFTGASNATIPVTLSTPTASVRGGVLQQTAIADLTAAPTQADFNGLLAKLKAAGILA